MKKVYLAAPYSVDSDSALREQRACQADRAAAQVMKDGYVVFSPISHSHRIAHYLGNHSSHDFWLQQDFEMLALCDELWILMHPGWNKSHGIAMEKAKAEELGLPVKYLEM